MNLDQLLSALPLGDSPPPAHPQPGLTFGAPADHVFVEAPLIVHSPISFGSTSVVLVSAPAAMGKTTLATEIASRKHAALWRLAESTVGSATFTGTIQNLFGASATQAFQRLACGDTLFVLDALDEAKTRSPQGFDDFIKDVGSRLREPRARPALVILGRTETVQLVELLLEEAGVPFAHLAIDFFDHNRAVNFIERRLDVRRARDGRKVVHRGAAFAEVREALFRMVHHILGAGSGEGDAWRHENVRTFLGYAPVLEALVDFLDESRNPADLNREVQALAAEFAGVNVSEPDRWRFLVEIVERLTLREQRKVVDPIRDELATSHPAWSGWGGLYGPQEQYARIVDRIIGPAAGPMMRPPPMPDGVSGPYDLAVREHASEHVFVGQRAGFANVVFQEYIYAWALTRRAEGVREQVRAHMRRSRFLPSPLIARFMLHFANADGELSGQDLGVLYDSLVSRIGEGAEAQVVVDGDEYEGSCLISLRQGADQAGTTNDTSIPLTLLDGLRFWHRLSRADVAVGCDVYLGHEGEEFVLGPDVGIDCASLCHEASVLRVDATGDGIVLVARSGYRSWDSGKIVRFFGSQRNVSAFAPTAAPPWQQYFRGRPPPPPDGDPVREDALVKLLRMFKRTRSRRLDTVLAARWSPEQRRGIRDELLNQFREVGALRDEGPYLIFDSSYDSLKSLVGGTPMTLTEPARALLGRWRR